MRRRLGPKKAEYLAKAASAHGWPIHSSFSATERRLSILMERDGLVTLRTRGGRAWGNNDYYRITDKGQQLLAQHLTPKPRRAPARERTTP